MTLSDTVANVGQDGKIAEAFPNCDERQKGIALQILHPKTDCQLEKKKQTHYLYRQIFSHRFNSQTVPTSFPFFCQQMISSSS